MFLRTTIVSMGLLLIGACQSRPSQEFQSAPEAKLLYERSCSRCHGMHGEGGPKLGSYTPVRFKDQDVQSRLTDDDIKVAIMNGRPMMPPFKAVLEEKQVTMLVEYVRGFK